MRIPGINELILKSIQKNRYEKYLEHVPNIKSERNEKIIAAILTIVASIILGLFAINPTLSTIAGLQKKLDDNKAFELALEEKINNLASLDQKYKSIQNDLPIVYYAVPKTPEIASLSAALQTIISSTSAVSLINLQTLQIDLSKQTLTGNNYSSFEFNVLIQGNYSDLISVLEQLMNFQRILTINNISIVKSGSGAETILQINIDGNAYFKP